MLRDKSRRMLAVGLVVLFSRMGLGAEFLRLPELPFATQGGDAFGVSADGTTIVGTSHNGAVNEAVKWSTSGMIGLLGAGDSSFARGISDDGSVIVGDRNIPGGQEAFRWTQNTGAVSLGDFTGGAFLSAAYGISSDTSVIVGGGTSEVGAEAFRWTQQSGFASLGDLPGREYGGVANAASGDGSVIVGYSRSELGTEAFRWTAASGMVGLDDLPGDGFFSEAYDVSADGSVVVGRSAASPSLFTYRAFRWTVGSGMIALPDLPGVGPTAIAEGISRDGRVIVGAAYPGDTVVAFAWDEFHGTRSIPDLLMSQGVDVGDFELGIARAASFDGTTIVGQGTNAQGLHQAWVARLDPGTFIPEPQSVVLAVSGGMTILLFGWCHLRVHVASRDASRCG